MNFEMPEIEIVKLEVADIVTASNKNPCEDITQFG